MKSKLFLFTATLILLGCVVVHANTFYNIAPEESVVITDEVDENLRLYPYELFENCNFNMVRGDTFNGYAIYEVYGTGDLAWLKEQLIKHLRSQGFEGDVLVMLVRSDNYEEVIEWL